MAVYLDKAKNKYRGMVMCHMLADTPAELHEMAAKIGIKSQWFQPASSPHYDVCLMRRKVALSLGAIEIDRRQVVKLIKRIRSQPDICWSPK